jgi:hypothetical protein
MCSANTFMFISPSASDLSNYFLVVGFRVSIFHQNCTVVCSRRCVLCVKLKAVIKAPLRLTQGPLFSIIWRCLGTRLNSARLPPVHPRRCDRKLAQLFCVSPSSLCPPSLEKVSANRFCRSVVDLAWQRLRSRRASFRPAVYIGDGIPPRNRDDRFNYCGYVTNQANSSC